jgi:hypothetical protein
LGGQCAVRTSFPAPWNPSLAVAGYRYNRRP